MGLEDKFFPEDGTSLTRFDYAMIRGSRRIGEYMHSLTGINKMEQTSLGYNASYLTAVGMFLVGAPLYLPLTLLGVTYLASLGPQNQNPLEEKLRLESEGNDPALARLRRALVLGLGPFIYAATSHPESPIPGPAGVLSLISGLSVSYASYLSLSHTPGPPKKNAIDKVKEFISSARGLLRPRPVLKPAA